MYQLAALHTRRGGHGRGRGGRRARRARGGCGGGARPRLPTDLLAILGREAVARPPLDGVVLVARTSCARAYDEGVRKMIRRVWREMWT
eukprot:3255326-Prymnesium_polylepis.1